MAEYRDKKKDFFLPQGKKSGGLAFFICKDSRRSFFFAQRSVHGARQKEVF